MSTWVWILIAVLSAGAGTALGAYLVLRSFRKGVTW